MLQEIESKWGAWDTSRALELFFDEPPRFDTLRFFLHTRKYFPGNSRLNFPTDRNLPFRPSHAGHTATWPCRPALPYPALLQTTPDEGSSYRLPPSEGVINGHHGIVSSSLLATIVFMS